LLMKLPTHFTIDSVILLSHMLCRSLAGTTLSKVLIMSSDSSVATPSMFCHVAWICWIRKLRAMSIDLLGRAPMCWAGRRLCSSDRVKIHQAMTLFKTYSSVL
jgi:hypothetical protein